MANVFETAHVAGELITPGTLNRIETNSQDGFQHAYSQTYSQSLSTVLNATTLTAGPTALSHTSKTGRVLVTVTLQIENTTANTRTLELTIAESGANLVPSSGVLVKYHSITLELSTVTFCYIDTSATVGSNSYNWLYRINAGNNTLRAQHITAIDI